MNPFASESPKDRAARLYSVRTRWSQLPLMVSKRTSVTQDSKRRWAESTEGGSGGKGSSVRTLDNDPDGVAGEIACVVLKSCCMEGIGNPCCLWCVFLPLFNCGCAAANPEGYFWQVTGTCGGSGDGCSRTCAGGPGFAARSRREIEAENAHNISLAFNEGFLRFERARTCQVYRATNKSTRDPCNKHKYIQKYVDRVGTSPGLTLVLPLQCIALDVVSARDLVNTSNYPRPPMVGKCLHGCCPTPLWAPSLHVVVGYYRNPQTKAVDVSRGIIFAVDVGPKGDGLEFVQAFYEAQARALELGLTDEDARRMYLDGEPPWPKISDNNIPNNVGGRGGGREAGVPVKNTSDGVNSAITSVSIRGTENKTSAVDELKSLMEMKQCGLLSDEEFAAAKAKVLGMPAPAMAVAVGTAEPSAPPYVLDATRQ